MQDRLYFYLLVLGTIITLAIVSLVSYTQDPDNVYHLPINQKNNYEKKYATELLLSDFGLLLDESLNYRDIKTEVAKLASNIDCVVMGSSPSLQISSFNNQRSFANECSSIINLSVPGSSIEDYYAFSWLLLQNQNRPKKIIFTLPEWLFNPAVTTYWFRNQQYQKLMMKEVSPKIQGKETGNELFLKAVVNLINPEYFVKSIEKIKDGDNSQSIIQANNFDYTVGTKYPVLLPDASLVYSKDYIDRKNNEAVLIPMEIKWNIGGQKPNKKGKTLTVGRSIINISGHYYSDDVVKMFTNLIEYLQSKKIAISFLIIPVHHNIVKSPGSSIMLAINDINPMIDKLASKYKIKIFGSFDPHDIKCNINEFYDSHHVKTSCLSKITLLPSNFFK
jgi:hypothetical protein